jgi:ketosteroid isomerase-like protein
MQSSRTCLSAFTLSAAMTFGVAASLAVIFAAPVFAQQNTAEKTREAIQDYVAQWQDRFNKNDVKGLEGMYINNAVKVVPNGQTFVGPQNIAKSVDRDDALKGFGDISLKLEDLKSKGDVAWGYVHWTVLGKDEKGTAVQFHGNSTNTWVLEEGSWKIALEGVSSLLQPEPAATPPQR